MASEIFQIWNVKLMTVTSHHCIPLHNAVCLFEECMSAIRFVVKPNVSFPKLNRHVFVISIMTVYLKLKTAVFRTSRLSETLRKKVWKHRWFFCWICAEEVIPLVVEMSMDIVRECEKKCINVCKSLQWCRLFSC